MQMFILLPDSLHCKVKKPVVFLDDKELNQLMNLLDRHKPILPR